jgi:hypothetical protein
MLWAKEYSDTARRYISALQWIDGDVVLMYTTEGAAPDFYYSWGMDRITQSGQLVWTYTFSVPGMNIIAAAAAVSTTAEIQVIGNVFNDSIYNGFAATLDSSGALQLITQITHTSAINLRSVVTIGNDIAVTGSVSQAFSTMDTTSILLFRTDLSQGVLCGSAPMAVVIATPQLSIQNFTATKVSSGWSTVDFVSTASGANETMLCFVEVEEKAIDNEVVIYPQPATTEFTVHCDASMLSDGCSIVIYSSTGQIVLQRNLTAINEAISCTDLVSGPYFYSLESAGQRRASGTFVKQ